MRVDIPKTKRYTYSPLRYPGGKAALFCLVDDIIKQNKLENVVYVEPFAGGAGVALALLMLEKVNKIIINDFDRAIFSFWKSILNHTDKFINKINTTPITIKEWNKQKAIYSNTRSKEFELGFATFFLNRTNRSGILNAGAIGGVKQLGDWKLDARFNKEDLISRIKKISYYKDRISVKNEDGIKLVKNLVNRKNLFIFLDPPYYDKGSCLYLNHYKDENHKKLADFLNSKNNMHWILTYDNVKPIQNLYLKRKSYKFSLNYHANESRKGSELLFLSDSLKFKQKKN
ncbi:MAG: DNA adenine methylase [Patescibacteria group bacterium]